MSKWIQTDDDQWCKKICDKCFDLVEIREWPDGYVVAYGEIDLNDYSKAEITSCITGYGYASIEDVKDQYRSDANQVIAECLFEQTSELELGTLPSVITLADAVEIAEEYMKDN